MSADTFVTLVFVAAIALVVVYLKRRRRGGFFPPAFQTRPILNNAESFLFELLKQEFPPTWHVMAQVSYGSFLQNPNRNLFMSINSKRADIVVLYPSLDVAAVFEYHGTGHYGDTDQSRRRAEISDDIKRRACAEAGVRLFEIPSWIEKQEIKDIVRAIRYPKRQTAEST